MEAYIIKAYRSAVGKAKKGSFRNFRSDDIAVHVIRHLVSQVPGLPTADIDDVFVGCANPEGEQGFQIGRQISMRALGISVPGVTVNRYCASGLESIAMAVAKVRAGMGHLFIAGGAESMSQIPMTGYKLAPNYDVANNTPDYLTGMGITAEAVARKYAISREAADTFAVGSHQKADRAIKEGKFLEEIVPIEVKEVTVRDRQRVESTTTVTLDEGVRSDTSLESLSTLKPVFDTKGIVTAGNASQTSDGAAFVLIASEEMVKRHNWKPIARLVTCAVGGVEPLYMGMGPCAAIPKALKSAGLSLSDIGLVELNEAFAAQALAVIQEGCLDPATVNVNGGAIALGHPLGCTGAKLSTQLINEMGRRKVTYGMVTACVGGGQGIAGIFEKLNH